MVILAASVIVLPAMAAAVSYAVITPYSQYVLDSDTARDGRQAEVGIVLGAGITRDGKPYRELQSRLDTAAAALSSGTVNKLLLSGDNRFENYNEPKAMRDYLITRHGVDPGLLQEDYAGRSTYESCERAAKVFGLERTVLISAGSHLPRAIYLCRHFGIEAYGTASPAEAGNAVRREALARVKAVLNVHVRGEPTVLGAPIPL